MASRFRHRVGRCLRLHASNQALCRQCLGHQLPTVDLDDLAGDITAQGIGG